MNRNRTAYSLCLLAVIAAGLASRRFPESLPEFMQKGVGDALWTTMVFLLLALWRPTAPTLRLGTEALIISFADELSQMYHAPWIDSIRATTIGHLALGEAFSAHDLEWYVVGVVLAVGSEAAFLKRNPKASGATDGI